MKPSFLEIVLALAVVVPFALAVGVSLLVGAYEAAKRWKEWVAAPIIIVFIGVSTVSIRWAFGVLSNL